MAALKLAPFRGGRLVVVAGLIGALGLVLWLVGLFVDPAAALFGWLTAFAYGVSIALGALIFLMIGYAANAGWPVAIRRLTESVVGIFPVLALAVLPVLLGAERLYLWVSPPEHIEPHFHHLLEHKQPYLNLPFFVVRAGFYFLLWIAVAVALRRWSFRRDDQRITDQAPHARERIVSALMLPPVALTLTFASFDWLMSLDPEWYSTAFGLYYFAGGFVGALGLITALAFFSRRAGLVLDRIRPPHFHALGRMLFAFSIFWAYIAFFQAMLIELANKPEEVTFFLQRLRGSWNIVAWLLVAGRFVVPFVLLLPRSIKFRPRAMAAMGGWILFMHYVDVYWLVAPALPSRSALPNWLDAAALAAVGGLSVAFGAWTLRGRPLLPVGDPLLEKAIAYRSPL